MKKVITVCLLLVSLLVGGLTADAKTTKKKSKAKSNSSVICKFKYYDDTISLLSNGGIKGTSRDKCEYTGSYVKLKGGYHVTLGWGCPDNAHGCSELLIVGDYIYIIGGGTTSDTIHDFTYNPSDKTVTVINTSGMSDREFMEYNHLSSMTVPLSHYEKFGKVTWIKKKP